MATTKEITALIQVKRDTAANWTSKNPVLASGEFGYDTTNKILKIGDGSSSWTNLSQVNPKTITVVQTTGTSTTSVMSQSAVTTALNNKQDIFKISGNTKDVNITPYTSQLKTTNVLRNIKLGGNVFTVNFNYGVLTNPYHTSTSPTTATTTLLLSSIIPSNYYYSSALYEIDLYIQMYSSSGSEKDLLVWSDKYNASQASAKGDEYKIAATSNYGRMQCVQLRIPASTYIKYSASATFNDFYLTVCGWRRIE